MKSNAILLGVFFVFAVGFVAYQRKFFDGWMPTFGCLRIDLLVDRLVLLDYWVASMFGDVPEAVGILDRVPILFGATAILAAGYAAGRFTLEAFQLERHLQTFERPLFAIGMGLNLVSLFTLAAGLAGLLTPWLFLPAMLALYAAALYRWWPRGEWIESDVATPEKPAAESTEDSAVTPWLRWVVVGTCVPAALVLVLGGMLPSYEFDVREYHLEIPKEWSQQGVIGFVPHNVYGNMPLGTEMHGLLAMVLSPGERPWYWGALVGKTIVALFPLLTALSLWTLGQRLGSPWGGALAAAIYLGIPWVVHVSIYGLIDAVLACYAVLTLHAAIIALQAEESDEPPSSLASPWILVGLLAGAAAACKYTGVPMVALPAAVIAFIGLGRIDLRAALIVVVVTLAGGGLWYAKNMALTGNPVYPLLGNIFGGTTRTPEKIEQWDRVHSPQPNAEGQTHSLAQLAEGLENVALKSEFISPILMPLAALALVSIWLDLRRRWLLLIVAWCLWMFVVWWGISHRLERFWMPAFPLLALLAGLSADWTSARWWRIFVVGLLLYGAAFELSCFAGSWFGETRFFVGLDYLRTDQPPIGIDRWSRIHSVVRPLIDAGSPRSFENKTLIIGKADVFDVDGAYLYNTCFDDSHLTLLLGPTIEKLHAPPPPGTTDSADRAQVKELCQELIEKLRAAHVTQIYVDWAELFRYRGVGNYGYDPFIRFELFDELTDLEILVEHDSSDHNRRRLRGFSVFLLNADFQATDDVVDRAVEWRAKGAKQEKWSWIPGR